MSTATNPVDLRVLNKLLEGEATHVNYAAVHIFRHFTIPDVGISLEAVLFINDGEVTLECFLNKYCMSFFPNKNCLQDISM